MQDREGSWHEGTVPRGCRLHPTRTRNDRRDGVLAPTCSRGSLAILHPVQKVSRVHHLSDIFLRKKKKQKVLSDAKLFLDVSGGF